MKLEQYYSNRNARLQLQKMEFAEGRAKGAGLYRIQTEAGLSFDVLIDRCLDIDNLRLHGDLISYTTETGPVHPAYFEANGDEWLRTFGGGFLATCGLDQTGEPCVDQGKSLGQHGRIDNIPAEQVGSRVWEKDGVLWAEIYGTMVQAKHQDEHLELERRIRFCHNAKRIELVDTVRNCGAEEQPYMLLYHINFGFPFLTPETKILLSPISTEPFDAGSAAQVGKINCMPDIQETAQNYLWQHTMQPDMDGTVTVGVKGEKHKVSICYPADELPILAQWQLIKKHNYVMAIEPTNAHLLGRQWEREQGKLMFLQPGEERYIRIVFSFDEDSN